jgi:hypothetical protein
MTAPFVLVTTHRIAPGRHDDLVAATVAYDAFIEANEPRVHAHLAYVDEAGEEVSLVQVHPDAASADRHLQAAAEHIGRGIELTETVAVTVYGEPGPALREALRHNAESGAVVTVMPTGLAGFVRS